jgi:hypothetical protein
MTNLALYRALVALVLDGRLSERDQERIRDAMDVVWYRLSASEREELDAG